MGKNNTLMLLNGFPIRRIFFIVASLTNRSQFLNKRNVPCKWESVLPGVANSFPKELTLFGKALLQRKLTGRHKVGRKTLRN